MGEGSEKYGHIIFNDPGYSLLTIGWMFLALLVVWMLNSLFLLPYLIRVGGWLSGNALLLSTLNSVLLFILVPYAYFRRRYIDHRIFTGLNGRLDKRTIMLCVVLSVGALMLTNVLQYFWVLLLQLIGVNLGQTSYQVEGLGDFLVGLLFIGVAPAVSEEYLFRGVIMRSVQGLYGDTRAILISAGLFSLMHMNLASLPTTFVVGLVMGYAVCTTNSLRSSIIMHFAHNTGILVLTCFRDPTISKSMVYDPSTMPQLLVYAAMGIFIMVLTMVLLRRKGALPGTLRVNRAAIPKPMYRDLTPFIAAAALMLCRILQVSI